LTFGLILSGAGAADRPAVARAPRLESGGSTAGCRDGSTRIEARQIGLGGHSRISCNIQLT